jgi:hypothetical protein
MEHLVITFEKIGQALVLSYQADQQDNSWVHERLNSGTLTLNNTFHLTPKDLHGGSIREYQLNEYENPLSFKVADLSNGYFKINKMILGISYQLSIYKDLRLDKKSFVAEKNVSIFSKIGELGLKKLFIGGPEPEAMPVKEFERLLNQIPNSYELRKYVLARVSGVVREFVETEKNGEEKFNTYMKKRLQTREKKVRKRYQELETEKYLFLINSLEDMLSSENQYSEAQWQDKLLEILLLIFPKYILVFKEAPVLDSFNGKTRKIDFLLVDSSGNVDIIEIKKPFDKSIVSSGQYRDNHIPLRELSGSVMQVEKYIFHLNKWGSTGEKLLTKKYKKELPNGLELKITNPTGLIIMGRDNNLTQNQKQDLEIIKRKYKSVVDIATYDDLLRRLQVMVEQLKKLSSNNT